MRISDWSSDVCSSDLRRTEAADLGRNLAHALLVGTGDHDLGLGRGADRDPVRGLEQHRVRKAQRQVQVLALHRGAVTDADQLELALERSEEHTSELQSLMRISYAVFCLKKKNKQKNKQRTQI